VFVIAYAGERRFSMDKNGNILHFSELTVPEEPYRFPLCNITANRESLSSLVQCLKNNWCYPDMLERFTTRLEYQA
jgi:hypothetical protein